jgi:O-antigen ligase
MPGASLLGAIRAVGYLIFLILAIEVGTQPDRTHRLGLALMIGIMLHGIFGLVSLRLLDDYSLWGVKEVYQGMLTGTFVNRNSIATFLGFGLILAVAFAMVWGHRASLLAPDRGYTALLTPQRLEIVGLWFAAGVLALAILLTQSRMGAAATTAGAFVTFIVLRVTFRTRPLRIALEGGIGLLVLLAFLIPAAGTGLIERALFTLVESSDRVSLYIQTWGMIQDRPLTGFGYDAFAPAFELYRDDPFVVDRYADLAHNTYLALWAEQGLVIGSIPVVLTAWAMVMIIQRLRSGEGDMAVTAAAIGVITLGALHSLVDFSLEIPANVYCFLLIVGLAMARSRVSRPKGDVPKPPSAAIAPGAEA